MRLLSLMGFLPFGESSDGVNDLIFCPSMGRYGNQLDHYLSMMYFTKSVGRRLILPPLISYHRTQIDLVPFHTIFDIEELRRFLDVIPPEKYEMKNIDSLFCLQRWMEVSNYTCQNCREHQGEIGCTLHGSPSIPFWEKLNVTFTNSYAIDGFDRIRGSYTDPKVWENIPNEIVALPGSILPFPAPESFNHIHQYLHFT